MINKLKRIIKKIFFKNIPVPQIQNLVLNKDLSYSQVGEDRIVHFIFMDKNIYKPIKYLELGTSKPVEGNNTYFFYSLGSSGTLVEADSSLIPEIKVQRPRDKVLNVGVNFSNQKTAKFYIFKENSYNTFIKEEAEAREKNGINKVINVVDVPLKSINNIIKENFLTYPDFLSIDIEGLDLGVLKSIDFEKYPIPVICAETCVFSENHVRPKDHSIADFMLSNNYFIYADTYVNTIFVNTIWFNSQNQS